MEGMAGTLGLGRVLRGHSRVFEERVEEESQKEKDESIALRVLQTGPPVWFLRGASKKQPKPIQANEA